MPDITIFAARRIHTMNPRAPVASHVAVREGRILGAGSLENLAGWGDYTLDETFADAVLLPGFVEGHSHLMAGGLWKFQYCGVFDARDPDGRVIPGSGSIAAVVETLSRRAAETAGEGGPVAGWGFDPIYFGAERLTREHLDQVSAERPVGVMHASGHILVANSAALKLADRLRPGIDHPGVPLGADGLPTGELKGPEAMIPLLAPVGMRGGFMGVDEPALRAFAKLAAQAGVTTATDLGAMYSDATLAMLLAVTGEADFPVRLVSLVNATGRTPAETVERARAFAAQSQDRLRLGAIKVIADGSIQGFSARLRWPGYYNVAPNGLWYAAPPTIREVYTLALEHGLQVHTHTNGDEATDLAIDCLQAALAVHPVADHRFTLQHCQLADASQFRRIKALGMAVNLFANHAFYWGDLHRSITVGPERAERMNACRTALDTGVPLAIHSDAPVTPMAPLFTAWCAVNRLTASGAVLGEGERISVAEALRAVTLGAAYTLKLDGEIGSIECGKRADFAVLGADPYEVDPAALKDVPVRGVIQGGRVFAA